MIKLNLKLQMEVFDAFTKNKVLSNYNFLNTNEKKKYCNSLKILLNFKLKTFETEFEKNNKKLDRT